MAKADIIDCNIDKAKKEILLDLDVTWPNGSSDFRKFSIKGFTSKTFGRTVKLSLTDKTNQMLFEVVFEWDTSTTGGLKVTERTQNDEMIIQHVVNSGMVKESYNINGNYRELSYLQVDEQVKRETFEFYQNSKKNKGAPSSATIKSVKVSDRLLQVYKSFDEFYSFSLNNTLHNNRDGELLAYLFTSENLAKFLGKKMHPKEEMVTLDYGKLCKIAEICSLTKCVFFFGTNPGCGFCLGFLAGCAIINLIGIV